MRFRYASILALVGVVVVGVIGIVAFPLVADFLTSQVLHRDPHAKVVMMDADALWRAHRDFVLALVAPWFVVWISMLVRQLRRGALPRTSIVVLSFALPTPVVAIAMMLHAWRWLSMVEPAGPTGLSAMLSLEDLTPGSWGLRFAVIATSLFVGVSAVVTRAK